MRNTNRLGGAPFLGVASDFGPRNFHPHGMGHVDIGNVMHAVADDLYAGCE